ncbi:hypothetical protein [Streptomyces netropsis]|uniref:Uncharacterized protein n=1 Tax=Streptomyces netropsis TaxID=55404 RepID=A0A7W7LAD5_STRNE|nr:hypothetical protein [Streptomyces netropsis]MBB4886555.1 hypothetical protein [Streptomyces netropsis]GGR21005.1 hypothetical protein GCM10010219_27470 [Streptomyces netropsis]
MSTEADPMPSSAPLARTPLPVMAPDAWPPPPWRRVPAPPPGAGPGDPHRRPGRTAAAAACAVLGLGLIGGAVAGTWLTTGPGERGAAQAAYARGADLWRTVPVDTLFPRTIHSATAGPGGAARHWTRIGVAADAGCVGAFDPLLARALAPVGCKRLLRAAYTDATSTRVTTVGLLVTDADAAGMRSLGKRFTDERLGERPDLMPRPYAPKGTAAERFGDAQRASWRISVLTDAPAVVYAVTGFADARTGTPPQPAEQAARPGATTAPAQAGLGHDANALADRLEQGFRHAMTRPQETPR